MKKIFLLPSLDDAVLNRHKYSMRKIIEPQPEKTEFSTKLTNLADGVVGALFTDANTHPVDGQAIFPNVKTGDILYFTYECSEVHIQVTSVHPERIRDINEEKAIDEGFVGDDDASAVEKFVETWEVFYPGTYESNVWVWVIKFQRITITKD